MAVDALFQTQWGRHKLWIAGISTDNSRTQVVHELTAGDEHPVQDRGLRPRRVRCELLFDEFPEENTATPTTRFRLFKEDVDAGIEAIFVHPIDGAYLAKVGEFTYDLRSEYEVPMNVSVEFIAIERIEPVSPAGAGTSSAAGEGAVTQASDDLDAALAAVDMESDIPALARTAHASWTSGEEVTAREVFVDNAAISERIAAFIEDEGLEDDLALWDVFTATVLLGDAVRSAAIAATSEVPSVFVVRVQQPIGLLALMARIYGGADAEDRARQAEQLNDIRTVAWLEPGTDLILPVNRVSRQRVF